MNPLPNGSVWLSLAGFAGIVSGIGLQWGIGYALIAGGVVLFITGGLAARREGRA